MERYEFGCLMDLTKYKLRCGGMSQRIFSLSDRAHLSAPDSMMAALLSRSQRNQESLYVQDAATLNVFLNLVNQNELTGFVLESIYMLKLENRFRSLTVAQDGSEVDLLTLMIRQSALEAIKFEKFEKKFVSFLNFTSRLNDRVIWLKGIVTSRTCYSDPVYRLSGDFDCYVNPTNFAELFQVLTDNQFCVITGDTGFCNQLGVGPVGDIGDVFLTPSDEFVPSAVCGLYRNRWPLLDIKVNPLDRGLRMVELDRFEKNAISVQWREIRFSAPDLLDQLMIALTHFEKDRFIGWKQLLDIKLISEKINETQSLWDEFIRRCHVEGISTACSAGLSLARERLELQGVDDVIERLSPRNEGVLRRLLTFTVTPLFYWNTSSALMLYVNAKLSEDSVRKMHALSKSLWPSKQFLSKYYFAGKQLNLFSYTVAIFLHWLVFFLPGGVVRRSFGQLIWKQDQFGAN
jgi:Uncharacterised nucleotidyltransferase